MARLRMGMAGGGNDASIGNVHRIASRIDDRFELVAGALSSSAEKSAASAEALNLPRSYANYIEMAKAEASRDDGIQVVSIVTPNHVHADAAIAFLSQGIHVVCDKPLTSTLEDARRLEDAITESKALFVLTHNYTGYPMIRQARAMVESGTLGDIRIVQAEYPQDWLTTPVEKEGLKQAEWRTDPKRSGAGGSIGDIGTHAHNLACFVSGLTVESLAADLQTFGTGRSLDDNAHIMLRFAGGARGLLWCSQVAPGNENGLKLRVYGDKGGLEWKQEDPNYLWFTEHGKPRQLITRSGAGAMDAANNLSRIPPGHPEGYLEGFANIYTEVAQAVEAMQGGNSRHEVMGLLPGITEGMAGMLFIHACVESSKGNSAWVNL